MALKTYLDTVDDLDESIKAHYKQEGDKFVLDIEGVDDHPRVKALKTANADNLRKKNELKTKADELEAKLKDIPEDFDPEEYVRLKAAAGDPNDPDAQKKRDEHLQKQKDIYEQRISAANNKHRAEIEAREKKLGEKDGFIKKLLVDEGLTKALIEAGVSKDYLKAAKALLRDSVVVNEEEGTYVARVKTDVGEEEVAEFVKNWAQGDEGKVFIAKPTGGDSHGGNGSKPTGENPWHKDQVNVTKQHKLIAENPERARSLAKAAGAAVTW